MSQPAFPGHQPGHPGDYFPLEAVALVEPYYPPPVPRPRRPLWSSTLPLQDTRPAVLVHIADRSGSALCSPIRPFESLPAGTPTMPCPGCAIVARDRSSQ